MKTIIIFASLILAVNCQDLNSGFRLDGLQILGNNNGLNSGLENMENRNIMNGGNAGRFGLLRSSTSPSSIDFNNFNNNMKNQLPLNPRGLVILNDLNTLDLLKTQNKFNHPPPPPTSSLNNHNLALGNTGLNDELLTPNRLNGLNGLTLNNNGLKMINGFNFATMGTHLGLDSGNGMMGMILGGNGLSNKMSSSSSNNYPSLPNLPQMPTFTDNLNHPQQPIPVPQSTPYTTPTLADYQKEDLRFDQILGPGVPARLPQLPPLPVLLPSKDASTLGTRSLTADLFDDQLISGQNRNQPLFDFPIPQNNTTTNQNNANNTNNMMNNMMSSSNNMMGNMMSGSNNIMGNNFLSNNRFYNGRLNSGQFNNVQPNNGINNALDSSFLASSGSAMDNRVPIEVSQFSTKIIHDTGANLRLQQQSASLLGRPNGF